MQRWKYLSLSVGACCLFFACIASIQFFVVLGVSLEDIAPYQFLLPLIMGSITGTLLGSWLHLSATQRERLEAEIDKKTYYLAEVNKQLLQELNLRKKAELALAQQRDKATELSQNKSRFMASLSHEIRTPLTAIIGFSQILQVQLASSLDKKHIEELKYIQESGQHLQHMMESVLNYARAETGAVKLRVKAVSRPPVIPPPRAGGNSPTWAN